MRHRLYPEGFEGHVVEAELSSFLSGPKLFFNGQPAPKGKKRGEFALLRDDGKVVVARWKPVALGFDVPQLIVDGKHLSIAEPLKWYQLVWSAWPLLLVFFGGAIGGLAGGAAAAANIFLWRTDISRGLKYALTGAISVFAFVVYLVLATLVQSALG